jgi:hypothetical protein
VSDTDEATNATPAPHAPPKRGRTGLIVALVVFALLLLLACGVAAYFIVQTVMSDASPSTPSAPAAEARDTKGEVGAAFAFIKGMGSGDIELFKTVMPAETLKTVPEATWDSMLTGAAADPTTFGELAWSGDGATADFSAGDGSNGTIGFRPAGTGLVIVTIGPEASESEATTLTVVKDAGRWTVTTFETVDGVLQFDAESVKALGQ